MTLVWQWRRDFLHIFMKLKQSLLLALNAILAFFIILSPTSWVLVTMQCLCLPHQLWALSQKPFVRIKPSVRGDCLEAWKMGCFYPVKSKLRKWGRGGDVFLLIHFVKGVNLLPYNTYVLLCKPRMINLGKGVDVVIWKFAVIIISLPAVTEVMLISKVRFRNKGCLRNKFFY